MSTASPPLINSSIPKPDSDRAIDLTRQVIPPIATRISVLLIDDQSMVAEILQRNLSKEADIDFHYCNDPTLAITTAIDVAPTVILQDLVMPDVDGLMLLRWFRLNPATKDIPMIALSCKEDAHLKAEAFTHGANDYLIKFPDAIELIARIRYHSQAYQTLKALQAVVKAAQDQAQQLADTLDQVQEMQHQIIQVEQLTDIGRMVAGIAREINNPINFIHGNVQLVNGYIQDLLKLIQLYQQTYPDRTHEINEMSNDLDLPFISTNLPKMMDSMTSASERIHNMVLSLQNFSRLDEPEKNLIALHKSLDHTLILLGHRLNFDDGTPKILINRDYQDIPLIDCYAAQINQVFVHVLNNAIDALELVEVSRSVSSPPAINIVIKTIGLYYVEIKIQDNGIGIAPEILDHIFEPFFTTKARCEGAGIGLAICHKVMQKHSGSITVQSILGQGSTCRLQFPIQLAVS